MPASADPTSASRFGCSDATQSGKIDIDGTTVYCQVDPHYKWTKIAAWEMYHKMTPDAVEQIQCAGGFSPDGIDCKFSDAFINSLVPAGSTRIYKIETSQTDPAYITTNRDYEDTVNSWNVGPPNAKWPDVRGMVSAKIPTPEEMKNAGKFTNGERGIDFLEPYMTKGGQGQSCNRQFIGHNADQSDCYHDGFGKKAAPGTRCISGGKKCPSGKSGGFPHLKNVVLYIAEFTAAHLEHNIKNGKATIVTHDHVRCLCFFSFPCFASEN